MPMSDSEKKRVIKMLDDMDNSIRAKILAAFDAFLDWLSHAAKSIYQKIRDKAKKFWRGLRECFS